jgi:hypothetical protein
MIDFKSCICAGEVKIKEIEAILLDILFYEPYEIDIRS